MEINKKKKILVLGTQDAGGAAEYMYKLCKILIDLNHEVIYLVKYKSKNDGFIRNYPSSSPSYLARIKNKIKEILNLKKKELKTDSKYSFFNQDEITINIDIKKLVSVIDFEPNVVFSGWTAGFINSSEMIMIKQYFNAKVFVVTVDMNAFTGGCHYAWDCNGYINGCNSNCPAILTKAEKEVAKVNFDTKIENVRRGDFRIISGSGWTQMQARKSKIYGNQKVILNINSLIDTSIMNSNNRIFAKNIFDLDKNKFYILTGFTHQNSPGKGFDYFIKSLNILWDLLDFEQKAKICILVVSKNNLFEDNTIHFAKRNIEFINDYRLLSLLYQSADLFVNSSIEDSGPMMVSEALACGTPVVGFDMGVVNNLVINGFNGYKANLRDSNDLANGIKLILELNPEQYMQYSQNSSQIIEEESSFNSAYKQFELILEN